MVGTMPSVDTYRDIAVTLVLVKVYNRVQKMRAHVIILYFHIVNNISMQLLVLNDVTRFIEYLQLCSHRIKN